MQLVLRHLSFTAHVLSLMGLIAMQASAARETTTANRWAKVDICLFDPAQPVSSPSKALKALVRSGIPVDLRPNLWLLLSGGAARKAAAPPRHYAALLRRAASAQHTGAVDAAELGAELTRAFGTHPILSSVKGMRAVLRLLEVSPVLVRCTVDGCLS